MRPKTAHMAAGKRDRLMSDSQWDDFWTMIESKRAFCEAPLAKLPQIALAGRPVVIMRRPTSPESATSAPHAKGRDHETIPHAKGRNQRSHRCGNCAACRAQDCGRCKNCRDKPRFGGPGIKKKACLARICHRDPDEIASDDDDATVALDSPPSGPPSSRRPSRLEEHQESPLARKDQSAYDDNEMVAQQDDDQRDQQALWHSPPTSAGPSQLASPAIRPCSPSSPHEVKDSRLPLSALSDRKGTTCMPASCQLDVLSQMASQIPPG